MERDKEGDTKMDTLTFLDLAPENRRLIAVRIAGKLTAEELEPFYSKLENIADSGENALLYVDLQSYDGFELATVKQKLSHMKTLWKNVERVAYVLDMRWMHHYISLIDAITPMSLRAFSHDQQDSAKAWILATDMQSADYDVVE